MEDTIDTTNNGTVAENTTVAEVTTGRNKIKNAYDIMEQNYGIYWIINIASVIVYLTVAIALIIIIIELQLSIGIKVMLFLYAIAWPILLLIIASSIYCGISIITKYAIRSTNN